MELDRRPSKHWVVIILLVVLGISCLCMSIFAQGLVNAEGSQFLPVSILAENPADYASSEQQPKIAISLNIIEDIFRDETDNKEEAENQISTVQAQLLIPVPSVTPVLSFTPTLPSNPNPTSTWTPGATSTTSPSATPIPSRTDIPSNTVALNSPTASQTNIFTSTSSPIIPQTATSTINIPPSNTPTSTTTSQPTLTPTYTRIPTKTFTHTMIPTETHTPQTTATNTQISPPTATASQIVPETINVDIIIPSEGQIITDRSQTGFEAEAWVGNTRINGKDIQRVEFIVQSTGRTQTEFIVLYCAFGGDSVCNLMSEKDWKKMKDGSYTIKARACSAISGDCTGWVTKTFIIQK